MLNKSYFLAVVLLMMQGLFAIQTAQAAQEKRVALVIGNSKYQKAPLRNPANDASDIAAMLKELGFATELVLDVDQVAMKKAIRGFNDAMKNADVRVFYYAGHGVSVEGENYMIPLAAEISNESHVQYEAIRTSLVLDSMEKSPTGANILILDACRDNPLPRSTRSSSGGLTKMSAPVGSLILYATAPGEVALDGNGRNGTFTKHLLRSLAAPGVHIEDLALDVRVAVMGETGNAQVPWSESSMTRRIYLAGNESSADDSAVITQADNTLYESEIVVAYRSAAESGDAVAQARLGFIYDVGRSVPQNKDLARRWYEKAVAQGELNAAVNLGVMFSRGDGVAQDHARAFELFQLAAVGGSAEGQRNLGTMFQDGEHVAVDFAEARRWYERAANRGSITAMVYLGDMYSRGFGVPQNDPVALQWYRKAAALGSAAAQSEVGYYYDQGLVVPQDYQRAVQYFRESSQQNHPAGTFNLAEMYELGKGVEASKETAIVLYERALELGFTDAADVLSRLKSE